MTGLSRRKLVGSLAALGGAYGLGLVTPRLVSYLNESALRRAVDRIQSAAPVSTGLDLAGPIARLVGAGVIDRPKFEAAHERFGRLPDWVSRALDGRPQELVLAPDRALYNLALLWPLGLATKGGFNDESPLIGPDLATLASTGGWVLGRAANGAAYFNAVETMTLDRKQSAVVRRLAEGVFRPCCGNSTFLQDCNHGSAMLGLIELAAADGRDESQILDFAKAANAQWFPEQYVELALYFDEVEGVAWDEVPAARLLSAKYSSIGGWRANVHAALIRDGILLRPPRTRRGSGCAV